MRDVRAHAVEGGGWMGGGFDAGDIEFRQGFGVAEDGFELGLEGGHFLRGEFEAGEVGNIADVNLPVRHGRRIGKAWRVSKCEVGGRGGWEVKWDLWDLWDQ